MPWLPDGDAQCDTCEQVRIAFDDRHHTIQVMRAAGWRHMKGTTLGQVPFETILCPGCTKEQKRKTRTKQEGVQEALPLDWQEEKTVGGQGVSSR